MDVQFSSSQLVFGFILAALTGQLAWQVRALNASGAAAATLVGGFVFGFGGYPWAALLLVFFISSTALSRLFAGRKQDLEKTFEKGSRRDWGQVAANGGAAAILALLHALYPEAVWPWLAFGGAMAAVNADTWATELGVLSKRQPVLITSGKPVPRGASGGITPWGTLASLAGAFLVAAVGWAVFPQAGVASLLPISLGGLAGSLLDSALGASVQVIYLNPETGLETEKRPAKNIPQKRGWPWMNNDLVNFISSVGGALVSLTLWALFQ
ncbi:MAG: DUF92 domain-containing protein [Anaerolineae bacterium]|nr:DUF92 domain-containing protein [Anaerolineae bacterium]